MSSAELDRECGEAGREERVPDVDRGADGAGRETGNHCVALVGADATHSEGGEVGTPQEALASERRGTA